MKAPAGLKSPVGLVTVALTAAILLAVSLLIATSTRGEAAIPRCGHLAGREITAHPQDAP